MLVREILERHGCTFSLRTDASDGGITRFTIDFPAAAQGTSGISSKSDSFFADVELMDSEE